MRLDNITDEQFKAMERLANRYASADPDAAILKTVIEKKKNNQLRHSLKTIALTTEDTDVRRIANDEYRKAKYNG